MTRTRNNLSVFTLIVSSVIFLWVSPAASSEIDWMHASVAELESDLIAEYGDAQRRRGTTWSRPGRGFGVSKMAGAMNLKRS